MTSSSPFIRLLRPNARFVAWIQSRKGEEADKGEKKEKKETEREDSKRESCLPFYDYFKQSQHPNIETRERFLDLGFSSL